MRTVETKVKLSILSLLGTLAIACDGIGSPDIAARFPAVAGEPTPASASLMGNEVLAPDDEASQMGDEWEAWLSAETGRIRKEKPELHDAIRSLEAMTTRARTLRIAGPILHDPDVSPLLLDRVINGNDTDEMRAALIEALPRTGGSFGPAIVSLLTRERDAHVRATMVGVLRHVDAGAAHLGLSAGLTDSDARVRGEAVRVVADRGDGEDFAEALVAATGDRDQEVRRSAVQALGALGIEAGKDALVVVLSVDDPEFRFLALRALERIDATYVAALPQVRALQNDPDPRVAMLALRLTE